MPAAYQHLRLRLRIEQTRLLNWGQNVGLLEEMLEKPSRSLQTNRNIILDILLEIQSTFKACMKIASSYDTIAPQSSGSSAPAATESLLRKTLAVLEKTPQLSARLQWAMVKKDDFIQLIDKLIRYNDTIESFLDKAAMDHLQLMQQRTYMMILQLTDKVDELKDLSHALQIRPHTPTSKFDPSLSRSSTLVADSDHDYETAARLADFKAQHTLPVVSSHDLKIQDLSAIRLIPNTTNRPTDRPGVVYHGKQGWVEWKSWDRDGDPNSSWNQVIEGRVKSLANLLSSKHKPKEFRAPQCLGYFEDETGDDCRFGFVYESPVQGLEHVVPISLRDLLDPSKKPSLNKRLALGHAIAESLMYLHSVNWLHKGVRSNNILFPSPSSKRGLNSSSLEYLPILSGFDYARPDLPDSVTERSSPIREHELYRHPELTSLTSSRSKKSHDIYSLGIVLVEIAFWQPVEDILQIELDKKGATRQIRQIREQVIQEESGYFARIDSLVGETYGRVVRRCLVGGSEIGIPRNGDETDPKVGVEMQRVFLEEIVGKLSSVRV
jgi:hypothetical protein